MLRHIRPRLITFDITGTLLVPKFEEIYTEIGSEHGLPIEPRKLARSFENTYRRLSVEHPIFGKHTGIGWQNWWRQLVYNVYKDQCNNISDATLEKIANNLIRRFSGSICWHTNSGAIELLQYLRKKGMILGVISNFDERLEVILVNTSLRGYFSFVLTSYDFGVEKPDTSIFSEALKLAKKCHNIDMTPQEAIHIGDSIKNDYIGAKNANWNARLIRHHEDEGDAKVPKEHVFKNLRDLKAHFSLLLDKSTL